MSALANTNVLLSAIEYATVAHHGQMRSGTDKPYIVHPIDVARVLLYYLEAPLLDPPLEEGEAAVILQAAVLHDVIEDTSVTFEDLERNFGRKVAEVVQEVSDDPSLSKKEQREYLFEHAHKKSRAARMVKIADAISNMRATGFAAPANWSRSLKLSYVKTCEKVGYVCHSGGGIPQLLWVTFCEEVAAAKTRLAKENYVPS